MVMARQGLGR